MGRAANKVVGFGGYPVSGLAKWCESSLGDNDPAFCLASRSMCTAVLPESAALIHLARPPHHPLDLANRE